MLKTSIPLRFITTIWATHIGEREKEILPVKVSVSAALESNIHWISNNATVAAQ